MKLSVFERLAQEPVQSAVITGFAALGSAAIINIASNYLLGSASAPGTSGFLLAAAVSLVAGTIAGHRALKARKVSTSELMLAEMLARADFSSLTRQDHSELSPMAIALTSIAERQLQNDTAHARLINDASLRQEQLFAALDCLPDEIAVYDKQGLLVATNKAFSRRCNAIGAVVASGMLQREVLNALAKSHGAALPMNERETWFKLQSELREESVQTGQPVRFLRFDGEPATLFVKITAEGNHVEIISNIDHLVEMEERVGKAEREAAAADRIKAVTLSRLSHTIRTPMTGVMTAAELMMKSDLSEAQMARLDIIRRSASTLLGVVQDMFDLAADAQESAKAKEAPREPGPRRVILYSPVEQEMAAARKHLSESGFEVAFAESTVLAAEAASQISVSSHPVEMIIVPNLAYAKEMEQALTQRGTNPRPPVLLYSEFANGHEKPAVAKPVSDEIIPSHTLHPDVDILVVEDDDVNQIVFSQALQSSGRRFAIVSNGQQALNTIAEKCPKLILMDVSMPGMNGIEATRLIRDMTANMEVPPIIIGMTNHFLAGDKGKCLAAGMNDYTLKPEASSILEDSIESWLLIEPLKKAG